MAGQRVIYSYTGLKPPASLLSLIRHGEAAGVIFFGDNIASRAQIRGVIRELERADASAQNPVRAPLLLMTDQEGGQVRRLSGAPLLSEKQIGASGDPAAAATRAGTNAGRNLRGVGMNVNLAPVLDVYRKAGDFDDQYGRSYSKSPAVVSELGADFIAAQQQVGVAATAKHFPGLGAAARSQNTDLRPVTLKLSKSTLRNVDELPYKAAIAAGVRLVMVSWAVYPALDRSRPAGHVVGHRAGRAARAARLWRRHHHRCTRGRVAAGAGHVRASRRAGGRGRHGSHPLRDGHVAEGEQAMDGLQSGYLHGALGKAAFRASVQRVIELRSSLGG